MRLPSAARYGFWLAIARIATGVIWLGHGVPKFKHSEMFMPPTGAIVPFVAAGIATTTGFYHTFLLTNVQPNIALFAELVRLGEVLVGCSLVFGLLTRLGGLGGAFLGLNYVAAHGIDRFGSWTGQDGMIVVLSLLFVALPAGRVLGVDALLGRRRPAAVTPPPRTAVDAPTAATQRVEFVPEPPMTGPTAPKE